MAAGITAKIGRFLFSASARRMIERPMLGVTLVVQETGNESVAEHVIEMSRQLYAKKIVPEEQLTIEQKQNDTTSAPRKPTKH